MKEMFNLYPQPDTYTPDNRPRPIKNEELTIMPGETSIHSFGVPFTKEDFEGEDKTIIDFKAIYKLGLEITLVKLKSECKPLEYLHHKTILTWELTPNETLHFRNTLLDAKVQIKFTMADGSINYTEAYPIKLVDSLDSPSTPPTPPAVLVGIGYTED